MVMPNLQLSALISSLDRNCSICQIQSFCRECRLRGRCCYGNGICKVRVTVMLIPYDAHRNRIGRIRLQILDQRVRSLTDVPFPHFLIPADHTRLVEVAAIGDIQLSQRDAAGCHRLDGGRPQRGIQTYLCAADSGHLSGLCLKCNVAAIHIRFLMFGNPDLQNRHIIGYDCASQGICSVKKRHGFPLSR